MQQLIRNPAEFNGSQHGQQMPAQAPMYVKNKALDPYQWQTSYKGNFAGPVSTRRHQEGSPSNKEQNS